MMNGYMRASTLPPTGEDLLRALGQVALASVDDIVKTGGLRRSRVYDGINDLADAGLVDSAELGWTRDKVARFFFTDHARAMYPDFCSPWHEEWGRARLLQRLPLVEWAYQVAGEIKGLGSLTEFHWVESLSFDAAVRYRDGWAAIFWSGSLQQERSIVNRLRDFGRDMVELTTEGDPVWPGLLCFVVSDQWQRVLVERAVGQFGPLGERVAVWCIADDSRTGACWPLESRGWVHQLTYPREMGGWPWDRRIRQSPWAKGSKSRPDERDAFEWGREGSVLTAKILEFLFQRADSTTNMIREALGEDDPKRSVHRRLKKMAETGFIDREQNRTARGYRYSLSSRGMDLLVVRRYCIDGYRDLSLMRASPVVKRQSTLIASRFLRSCHAPVSCSRTSWLGIRRSRHWRASTPSSISAIFSQLPCFGV